jgi:hypothetical protein
MTIPIAALPTAFRNTLGTTINLDDWNLEDKNKRRHPVEGIALKAGAVKTVTLSGKRCS